MEQLKKAQEQVIAKISNDENFDLRTLIQPINKEYWESTIPMAPYSLVQLDGHKIDILYTVPFEIE